MTKRTFNAKQSYIITEDEMIRTNELFAFDMRNGSNAMYICGTCDGLEK